MKTIKRKVHGNWEVGQIWRVYGNIQREMRGEGKDRQLQADGEVMEIPLGKPRIARFEWCIGQAYVAYETGYDPSFFFLSRVGKNFQWQNTWESYPGNCSNSCFLLLNHIDGCCLINIAIKDLKLLTNFTMYKTETN